MEIDDSCKAPLDESSIGTSTVPRVPTCIVPNPNRERKQESQQCRELMVNELKAKSCLGFFSLLQTGLRANEGAVLDPRKTQNAHRLRGAWDGTGQQA